MFEYRLGPEFLLLTLRMKERIMQTALKRDRED